MAEAFARRTFAARDLEIGVSSCGMLEDGRQVPDEVDALMTARGLDVSGHRSRVMTRSIINDASLILGMERQHVREVVNLVPTAFNRTFTLVEFVNRLDAVHDPATETDKPVSLEQLLARIAETRVRRELLGRSATDEIDDPIGRPARVFARVADEIEDALARMVAHLWPEPGDAPGASHDPEKTPDATVSGSHEAESRTEARPEHPGTPDGAPELQHLDARGMREAARARRSAALRGPLGARGNRGRKR